MAFKPHAAASDTRKLAAKVAGLDVFVNRGTHGCRLSFFLVPRGSPKWRNEVPGAFPKKKDNPKKEASNNGTPKSTCALRGYLQ